LLTLAEVGRIIRNLLSSLRMVNVCSGSEELPGKRLGAS
jgi:hypothetical protein